MATPSIAANAYASLANLTDPSGLTKGGGEASGGPSFGALLKDAVGALSKTVAQLRRADAGRWPPARPTSSTWSPRSPRPRSRSIRWSRCATR